MPAAATAAARVRTAPAKGSVSPTTNPTAPNTTKPVEARPGRSLASMPRRAPIPSETRTIPMTSTSLSLVPNILIAQSTIGTGVTSMTRWPMVRTSEGADMKRPATSSEAARAAPAATAPSNAKPGQGREVRTGSASGTPGSRSITHRIERSCLSGGCRDSSIAREQGAKRPVTAREREKPPNRPHPLGPPPPPPPWSEARPAPARVWAVSNDLIPHTARSTSEPLVITVSSNL